MNELLIDRVVLLILMTSLLVSYLYDLDILVCYCTIYFIHFSIPMIGCIYSGSSS